MARTADDPALTGTVVVDHQEPSRPTLAQAKEATKAMGIQPAESWRAFIPAPGTRRFALGAALILVTMGFIVWFKLAS